MDVDHDYSSAAYHSKLLSIEPKPGLSKFSVKILTKNGYSAVGDYDGDS